ncbi:MAG: MarR family transcriptional regulator [Clostridium sp.]|jgi:DNA-binding MarR family transcriptional regulator|uniref:MarR family winged helix-turn-helix transcriptional regulator n=1 Tax=Clostridium sp. TaxID=1506 RepID=UPI0025BB8699|nr:MarR family transcriptional regulator [Clostridium sp.]MCH3965827.1 MarR family transcriptional regulator [Clostridium sp.]MCI1716084.1 MarR family transcriptional regulator [Clostridium sp.]MCI1800244.1 MarR family transcriptional regulator [Clostridium sp.]MCI1814261.1 MarR family transcriptional regulator [Clostridium sp.]MCI1871160.1 MarR family transcriptional regulator [Clostridium sp.]
MNLKKDSFAGDDKLLSDQAERIIAAFKNIHKLLCIKFKENADKYGLTVQQLTVIFYLYKHPDITLNQLSEHMMLTKSTVSGIIDRLTKQGIVARKIPEDNRRIVKLSLSEDFKTSHDIPIMKQKFISNFIFDTIKDMERSEIEKFISSLEYFASLIKK